MTAGGLGPQQYTSGAFTSSMATKETPFGPPKNPSKRNKRGKKLFAQLDAKEIKRLEKRTPFIKEGVLRSAAADAEEKELSSMKLTDLILEDDKELGKGSYGSVFLARHRTKPKMLFAVKKLLKQHF